MAADKEKTAKLKALQLTFDKLDKTYGKGSVMKLGDVVTKEVTFAAEETATEDKEKEAAPAQTAYT